MGQHLPRILEREEVRRLLDACNIATPTGARNRAMLELMYRAGLRVGEVCRLRTVDIRWDSEHLLVHRSKGDTDRVVPLETGSLHLLRLWVQKRPKVKIPNLFVNIKGEQVAEVSTRYVQQLMKLLARRAEVDPDRVTPHVLRHCYATELLEEGFTIREVQQLLGHVWVTTTQIYTHVRPAQLAMKVRERKPLIEVEDEEKDERLSRLTSQVEELQTKLEELAALQAAQMPPRPTRFGMRAPVSAAAPSVTPSPS